MARLNAQLGPSNPPHVPIWNWESKSTEKKKLLHYHELQGLTNMLSSMSTSSPMGLPHTHGFPRQRRAIRTPTPFSVPLLIRSYTPAFLRVWARRCLCVPPAFCSRSHPHALPVTHPPQAPWLHPQPFRTYNEPMCPVRTN